MKIRLKPSAAVIGPLLIATALKRRRGYKIGWDTIVKCRSGHLFTTIWVPGASLKALRLEPLFWLRFQYCPVGRHWSVVAPVNDTALTDADRLSASENRDIRIP